MTVLWGYEPLICSHWNTSLINPSSSSPRSVPPPGIIRMFYSFLLNIFLTFLSVSHMFLFLTIGYVFFFYHLLCRQENLTGVPLLNTFLYPGWVSVQLDSSLLPVPTSDVSGVTVYITHSPFNCFHIWRYLSTF